MRATLPPRLTSSQTLKSGETLRPDTHEDGSGAALEIVGDNLTIDFGGHVLRGSQPTVEPDQRQGTGLLVRGRNVTIKNLKVHGFKIGLIARDCPGLTIESSDFSYNWKQRLASTTEREDLSDWMSYHQNEKDEWLRYGAGIYLRSCDDFKVRKCRIFGGQCGLMLTGCDRGLVAENDFSFLSAIGLGMYRSSDNKIQHNKIDWCVRGYSHGVYNRGQDSAGILIYEQSSRNLFAYNSVTHGGDGFFLWAGQTTMDTGRGGCDDNLLFGNDFSHAPTNGIEATFSRNTFANNLVLECWHGVWGGYSYNTRIIGNIFGYNATAIAIEHGRENQIIHNQFIRDRQAIDLWKNEKQDPDWAYVKYHDTTSRDYTITHNRYDNVGTDLRVRFTDGVKSTQNDVVKDQPPPPATMEASGKPVLEAEQNPAEYARRFAVRWRPTAAVAGVAAPAALPGAKSPFLGKNALRGRRYILVDEWGPYDFLRPLLTPRENGTWEILGPKGRWRVVSTEGATLSASSGTVPGTVRLDAPAGQAGTMKVVLEYVGGQTTDHRGVVTPAGKPVRFGFSRFSAPIDWKIVFYRWSKAANPTDVHSAPDEAHYAEAIKGTPLKTLASKTLDMAGAALVSGLPADHYATVAEGSFTIPAGEYVLDVTTDDGCRVWLDEKPILTDAWKYQGPTLYSIPVTLGGQHRLRVEHFQIDGYAALRLNLRPKA
ncbi:MAG: right-handed parallel beta-helix repeat-containing protein [Armatimonas sp.]